MWNRRLTETTRGRLVSLLRRRSFTVEEMARELGVTDNAVRAQLASLGRDGLVRQDGVHRGPGKPSARYGLTAEFEGTLSQAYVPLLVRLLRELAHTLPADQLEDILRRLGRDWANELPRRTGGTRGAEVAIALLNELGGVTEVERVEGRTYVRGFSCPLAAAVQENPQVCRVIQSLLGELLGVEVREKCDRGQERLRCCFEIAAQS